MQHGGKILGQGSYGCVLSPPLECDNTNASSNMVSKFMEAKEAKSELKEFKLINKIDPNNRYHLGTPKMCLPTENANNLTEVKGCRNAPKNNSEFKNYRALLLKNGGKDLDKFCRKLDANTNTREFWEAAKIALEGLALFQKNHICHHDIKPSNLVYSSATKKMVFIDFGLMKTFKEILHYANDSQLNTLVHWSYPLDYLLLNRNVFQRFQSQDDKQKQKFINGFINAFLANKNDEYGSFETTFYYFYGKETILPNQLHLFFNTLQKETLSYKEYARRTIRSIDIYAMGMTLQYALNQFYSRGLVSLSIWEKGTQLFRQGMGSWNPQTRLLNMSTILSEYTQFLKMILPSSSPSSLRLPALTPRRGRGGRRTRKGGRRVNATVAYADVDPKKQLQIKEQFERILGPVV